MTIREETLAALEQTFYILLDYISDLGGANKREVFLQTAKSLYGLSHISYLGINIPSPEHGNYYVQSTYPDQWVERYATQRYVSIDPVVRTGLAALVPLDWADLPKESATERRFFGESREFGVGRHGLTFSLGGKKKESGIFCINSDVSDKEWRGIKRCCMRDFQILSAFFHNKVLEDVGENTLMLAENLSCRESECLKWAAEGKTAWETSMILGVSERCVRFHLDQARRKLNCLTKVQAVAKAVALGLVKLS